MVFWMNLKSVTNLVDILCLNSYFKAKNNTMIWIMLSIIEMTSLPHSMLISLVYKVT